MIVSKLFNMEVSDSIPILLKGSSLIRMGTVYFFLMRASNTTHILVGDTYLCTKIHVYTW